MWAYNDLARKGELLTNGNQTKADLNDVVRDDTKTEKRYLIQSL